MKLWRIWQTVKPFYGWVVAAVVAAETEAAARAINPGDGTNDDGCGDYVWAEAKDVQCEYLGEAKPGTQQSVICRDAIED